MPTYFTPKTQAFLAKLGTDNTRGWFQEHKDEYEEHVRAPALRFIEDLGAWMDDAGLPFVAEAKKAGGSLSRINRDIRFSKDKTPYNTHVIMYFRHLAHSANKPMPAFGIRFDTKDIGMGGGMWDPPTPVLNKIRHGIMNDPAGWKKFSKSLRFDGERLKTAPRGFDREHPMIEDLRLKSFLGHIDLTQTDLTGDLVSVVKKKGKPVFGYAEWLETVCLRK